MQGVAQRDTDAAAPRASQHSGHTGLQNGRSYRDAGGSADHPSVHWLKCWKVREDLGAHWGTGPPKWPAQQEEGQEGPLPGLCWAQRKEPLPLLPKSPRLRSDQTIRSGAQRPPGGGWTGNRARLSLDLGGKGQVGPEGRATRQGAAGSHLAGAWLPGVPTLSLSPAVAPSSLGTCRWLQPFALVPEDGGLSAPTPSTRTSCSTTPAATVRTHPAADALGPRDLPALVWPCTAPSSQAEW
ncbi:Hypothetical predicted protein [Marmota monax]|uniref:Uncharacterized protein n=1 Tax=Marmota monax TaxID=9995 RepID=A0A5E4A0R1_MARMO|nr:Hypothetical predicted protein [Marmota monax]